MKIETKYFGELELEEKDIIDFPKGLLGFEDVRQYIIIDNPDSGGVFKWLQAVDMPELAFVIVNPFFVVPDYEFDVPEGAAEVLEIEKPENVGVYTIVVVPDDLNKMTTNLKAPIIGCRIGGRLVLVLTRKQDESIIIGDNIVVKIVAVEDGKVKLGISAPKDISIHRYEVYESIQEENKHAVINKEISIKALEGIINK